MAFPLQKHFYCEEIKNYREELKSNRERNISFGAIRFDFSAIRFKLGAIKFRLGAIKYALYWKPSALSAHFFQHAKQTFDIGYAFYGETAATAVLCQAAGAEVLGGVGDDAAECLALIVGTLQIADKI